MKNRFVLFPHNNQILVRDEPSYIFNGLLILPTATFHQGLLLLQVIIIKEQHLALILLLREDLLLRPFLLIDHAVEHIHDDVVIEGVLILRVLL